MDTLIFCVVILGLAWWAMTTGQRLADKADAQRAARRNRGNNGKR